MRKWLAAACALLAAAISSSAPANAHRTIVSPYTYYRDALPIFQRHCGRCHSETSVSGISLLRFDDARSRTWAIRQSLISGRMPPWFSDGDAIKRPAPMTARELDVLMTWASGGAPEGDQAQGGVESESVSATLTPGLALPMPAPFTLASSSRATTHEVVLPAAALRGRAIGAVDLRPGAPEIVRRAELRVRHKASDQVVALWQPGDRPEPFAANAGFTVPTGASLVLRMSYQRSEINAADVADRSEVVVQFAPANARPIRAIMLGDPVTPLKASRVFLHRVDRPLRAIAWRPVSGPVMTVAHVTLIRSDGLRTPLGRLEFRDGWQRRYMFVTPVELRAGDRIETRVTVPTPDLWTTLTGEPRTKHEPLEIAVEVID
jgi:hypothetical protein